MNKWNIYIYIPKEFDSRKQDTHNISNNILKLSYLSKKNTLPNIPVLWTYFSTKSLTHLYWDQCTGGIAEHRSVIPQKYLYLLASKSHIVMGCFGHGQFLFSFPFIFWLYRNFVFVFVFFSFWTMKRYVTLQSHDMSHDVMS